MLFKLELTLITILVSSATTCSEPYRYPWPPMRSLPPSFGGRNPTPAVNSRPSGFWRNAPAQARGRSSGFTGQGINAFGSNPRVLPAQVNRRPPGVQGRRNNNNAARGSQVIRMPPGNTRRVPPTPVDGRSLGYAGRGMNRYNTVTVTQPLPLRRPPAAGVPRMAQTPFNGRSSGLGGRRMNAPANVPGRSRSSALAPRTAPRSGPRTLMNGRSSGMGARRMNINNNSNRGPPSSLRRTSSGSPRQGVNRNSFTTQKPIPSIYRAFISPSSTKPSFKPPEGYKVIYCKVYNETHQLVTVTPVTRRTTRQVPRSYYIGTRNVGNNQFRAPTRPSVYNPYKPQTRYMMVRIEDYVVCSGPQNIQPIQLTNTNTRKPNNIPNTKSTTSPIPIIQISLRTALSSTSRPIIRATRKPIIQRAQTNNGVVSARNRPRNRRPQRFRPAPRRNIPIPRPRFPNFNLNSRRTLRPLPYPLNNRRYPPRFGPQMSKNVYGRPIPYAQNVPVKSTTQSYGEILGDIFRNLEEAVLANVPTLLPSLFTSPAKPQSSSSPPQHKRKVKHNKPPKPAKPAKPARPSSTSRTQTTTAMPSPRVAPTKKRNSPESSTETVNTSARPQRGRIPTRKPPMRRRPGRRRPGHRAEKERIRILVPESLKKDIDDNPDIRSKIFEEAEEEEHERKRRELKRLTNQPDSRPPTKRRRIPRLNLRNAFTPIRFESLTQQSSTIQIL